MFKMSTLKRVVGVATSVAVVLTPMTALGLANPTPDQHWAAPHDSVSAANDRVLAAVAMSDGSYYVAGEFNSYARSYGNAVLASASTGLSEDTFPDVDGDVLVTISDQDDGWYIGGKFNRVGELQRTGVAHILPDGTPDSAFNADIALGGTDAVYFLAMNEADDTLYVAGDLESSTFGVTPIDGGLVAVDKDDGSLIGGFTPPEFAGPGVIYTLAVDTTTDIIYAGGDFGAFVEGIGPPTARDNMAAFDATGALTPFAPQPDAAVWAMAFDPVSGDIYVGGEFAFVGGTPRNRLALIDAPTGAAEGFDPDMDGTVYAISINAADPTTLYAGGAFTTAGVLTRNKIAAIDTSSSLATGWNPDIDNDANDDVFSMALKADGSIIYAVGPFDEVNMASGSVARDGVAAFRISDGDDIAGFNQSMQLDPFFISLNDNDTSVLIGTWNPPGPGPLAQYRADEGATYGGNALLHILADGTVDPNFLAFADDTVYALALDEDSMTLYAGGAFENVNSSNPRDYLAAFDAFTGAAIGWDPDMGDIVRALELSSDGSVLYAGGDFDSVNQNAIPLTRNHLAALDTGTGVATAFDPDSDGDVLTLALSSDDGTLYAGGDFIFVNGISAISRQYLASFDTGMDTVNVTDFYPAVNDTVRALALSGDDGTLYAGGSFDEVNGNIGTVLRNYAAAFETTEGVATDFDPDAGNTVFALAIGPDGIVYLGGVFDEVGGDLHNYIAAVDPDTGVPDVGFDANLSGLGETVHALAHGGTDNGLLAAGLFNTGYQDAGGSELPYVATYGLAHYQDTATPTPTPVPPTPTPTPGGGGSSGGGGGFIGGVIPTPTPSMTPVPTPATVGDPLNLARYGLREGDTVSARNSADPDIYIVNAWGYKRLFLNPIIFNFYGHLGWAKVRSIVPPGRDSFPTSGLFRNCESNDQRVWAVEVTGEDTGLLHHVQVSGDAAVAQDPEFFKKVFCINNNEFNWYLKSPVPYTSLFQIPSYRR